MDRQVRTSIAFNRYMLVNMVFKPMFTDGKPQPQCTSPK